MMETITRFSDLRVNLIVINLYFFNQYLPGFKLNDVYYVIDLHPNIDQL